jgi:hypothetical protein
VRSRAIIVGRHYRASLDRDSVRPGSKTARAVGRITRELADAERLPGSLDVQGLAPVEDDVMEWGPSSRLLREATDDAKTLVRRTLERTLQSWLTGNRGALGGA